MSKLTHSIFTVLIGASLSLSCTQPQQRWELLPESSRSGYSVVVRYFKDDALVLPFELGVRASRESGSEMSILFAEQCKNVTVFGTRQSIAVFYDEIALTSFSGMSLGRGMPRTLLCDNSQSYCRDMLKTLQASGLKGDEICVTQTAGKSEKS